MSWVQFAQGGRRGDVHHDNIVELRYMTLLGHVKQHSTNAAKHNNL